MASIKSILKDIKSLSNNEIEKLFNNISELISFKSLTKSIYSNSREQLYSNGVACLQCGSTSVIKHGKNKDVQQFRCKDCGKTFNTKVALKLQI